jgi:uncharacterized protein with von Willebrand factor type A (vWA) domain
MTMQSSAPLPAPSGAPLLLDRLLVLTRRLREAGVPVSSSEVIDATHALDAVDALDRSAVRGAIATTLIKRAEDLAAFEVLFELAFPIRRSPPGGAATAGDEGRPRPQITTSLDRLSTDGSGEGAADLLELIMEAIRRGDPEALRALAEMAVDRYGGMAGQPDASERYFTYRVLRALELSRLMGEMLRAGSLDGAPPVDRAELAARIDAFKRLIASEVRNQLAERRGEEETGRAVDLLGTEDLDFLGASPRQLAAMREAIRPLARALATKMARRRRRRDRGRLDVRRTVRRSLSSGGVLLDPAFKRPKVARPDLYLLCDVSGSVAEFASFTLTLLQAMTGEFSRMRSFAFVDGIDEVTGHLKDVASFLEVRHVLYRADVVRGDGHSDYGAVFERFGERYGSAVDARSTIIVTGDARSNYHEPRLEALRQLHARARRVYLLNPEPESDWDTTDSIVATYRPALDGVYEVRNLRQLTDAIYRIT